jgi:hypothetical protein
MNITTSRVNGSGHRLKAIDPEGYRRWLAGKKRAFEDEVDLEMGVPNGK